MAATGYTDRELAELRQLLLGVDRERVVAALERLEQRPRFTDLQSETLGDALRLALQRDPTFAASMGDLIGKGVHATVQRDSSAFGQALAPALGPAIRKSVQLMLQGLLQSIQHTLDQRLSVKSLRWRWEARRTGRTFAEIVFLHTMLFRVEHLFLVHREGGVQLLHAAPPDVATREPAAIAAMLTAIQEFARDAFQAPGDDTLTAFAVGELQVQVETGSHALLAAVVRGQAPPHVRAQLREVLDRIETAMAPQLSQFAGETDPFEMVRPHVETCLLQSGRADQPARRRTGMLPWLLLAGLVALLSWAGVAWYRGHLDRARFAAFVAALRREPGYVVTEVDGFAVRGLRDPLAREPGELAREQRVSDLAAMDWQPFLALQEPFVRQRLTRALRPPAAVTFELAGATLTVRGSADHAFRERVRQVAAGWPGVDRVDLTGLSDEDELAFRHAATRLRQLVLPVAVLRQAGDDRRGLVALLADVRRHAVALQQTWDLRARFGSDEADPEASLAAAREVAAAIAHEAECPLLPVTASSTADIEPGALRFEASLRP